MTDISLLILSVGVSMSVIVFSLSHAYRVFHELTTKKTKDVNHTPESQHKKDDQDLLIRQLEEFQSQRFAKPMNVHSERTRMIAQRIRMEEEAKKKNAN